MHELVVGCPDRRRPGTLLVELRTLEEGPTLFSLNRPGWALNVGEISEDRIKHEITEGRLALLLDGFDELVQKVTYDTADKYLKTLLDAATGEAKIVLTTRTQHFRDDEQIRRALLDTTMGRDAARILDLEDFSDTQIRDFLTRLHTGDAAGAQRRFDRIERIKDLLGLSRNPRMLAFIAELPDARLDEAERSGQSMGAADLYREILDHWLEGEVKRQQAAFGLEPLPEEDRLAACRALALRSWASHDSETAAVNVEDLVRTTRDTWSEAERLKFSPSRPAHHRLRLLLTGPRRGSPSSTAR
jgi:hypothetical protein